MMDIINVRMKRGKRDFIIWIEDFNDGDGDDDHDHVERV